MVKSWAPAPVVYADGLQRNVPDAFDKFIPLIRAWITRSTTTTPCVVRFGRQVGSSENGVGNFSLPTQEVFGANKFSNVQATETWVIGTKSVNEILFQLNDSRQNTSAAGFTGPTVSVASAFTNGGNSAANYNRNRNYELQENNTITVMASTR